MPYLPQMAITPRSGSITTAAVGSTTVLPGSGHVSRGVCSTYQQRYSFAKLLKVAVVCLIALVALSNPFAGTAALLVPLAMAGGGIQPNGVNVPGWASAPADARTPLDDLVVDVVSSPTDSDAAAVEEARTRALLPYLERGVGQQPFQEVGLEFFPHYLADFVHPGFHTVAEGTATIGFNSEEQIRKRELGVYYPLPPFFKNRDAFYESVIARLCSQVSSNPSLNAEILKMKNEKQISDYGYGMAIPDARLKQVFGHELMPFFGIAVDPRVFQGHKDALIFAEKTLLPKAAFLSLSSKKLLSVIRQLHFLLAKNDPQNRGKWRQNQIVISRFEDNLLEKRGDLNRMMKRLEERLEENGATKEERAIFYKRILPTFKRGATYDDVVEELNQQELAIFKKAYSLAQAPKDIPVLMRAFAESLQFYVATGYPAPAVAAWAHMEIVRIHPFADGNGRMARLLMNVLLEQGGYLPVVIHDNQAYINAVETDLQEKGAFAAYLMAKGGPIEWVQSHARQTGSAVENEFIPEPGQPSLAQRKEPCGEACQTRREACKTYSSYV